MSDKILIEEIAKKWIELGGDSEGVLWAWSDLYCEVKRQESCDLSWNSRCKDCDLDNPSCTKPCIGA